MAGIELGEIKATAYGRGTYRAVVEVFDAVKLDKRVIIVCKMNEIPWHFSSRPSSKKARTRFHPRMQFPAGCNCRVRASPHQISLLPFVAVPLQYIILNMVYLTLIRLCLFMWITESVK